MLYEFSIRRHLKEDKVVITARISCHAPETIVSDSMIFDMNPIKSLPEKYHDSRWNYARAVDAFRKREQDDAQNVTGD